METKIVNTWLIENNKLVNKNKKVSSIKYKDLELYFLIKPLKTTSEIPAKGA